MRSMGLILSFFFFFALVLLSCGSVEPQLTQKVTDPRIPVEGSAYSILPPSGDNWSVSTRTDRATVMFVRQVSPASHVVKASVKQTPHGFSTYQSPDEFLARLKNNFRARLDERRYVLQLEEIRLDNRFGPYGVRYYIKYVDHYEVTDWPEKRLFNETYGYIFRHPHDNDLAVDINYGEQGDRETIDPHFEEAAQKFIDGLKLKKPEKIRREMRSDLGERNGRRTRFAWVAGLNVEVLA